MIERLERLGVTVGRRTELVSFTDEGERVIARLRGPEGQDEICEANYIAAATVPTQLCATRLAQAFLEVLTGLYRELQVPLSTKRQGSAGQVTKSRNP